MDNIKPLALDAFAFLQLQFHIAHHRLIQRSLFAAEIAVLAVVHFVRQILDDGRVGFHPAQDERLDQTFAACADLAASLSRWMGIS